MNLLSIGIVIIGRNEGNRLKASLLSVMGKEETVVYVDSGSSDGSVELAKSLGASVVELDLSIPFTAGRGRNAGFEHLLQLKPEVEFVQFVDGDSLVVEGWLERAVSELIARPDVVVVCGRCQEEFPANSIYNRLCDIEWNTPIGETKACGGSFMIRATAFTKAGGFNPTLIAGEEPELCVRLRKNGGKILRLEEKMVLHDADITSFTQCWKREVRNGHAYAEGAWLHGAAPERHWVRESLRSWFWALFLPLLAVAALWATQGLSIILLLMAYLYLACRVYYTMRKRDYDSADAFLYAVFSVIEKFPKLQGQIKFHISRLLKQQRTLLVKYKNPDITSPTPLP
jgi:GT2 family glycosyltransferase